MLGEEKSTTTLWRFWIGGALTPCTSKSLTNSETKEGFKEILMNPGPATSHYNNIHMDRWIKVCQLGTHECAICHLVQKRFMVCYLGEKLTSNFPRRCVLTLSFQRLQRNNYNNTCSSPPAPPPPPHTHTHT